MQLFDVQAEAADEPRGPSGGGRPRRSLVARAWRMLDGVWVWERELRLGFVALPVIQEKRAAQCRACPKLRRYGLPLAGLRTFWFCGDMGADHRDAPSPGDRSCGCLVLEGTGGTMADDVATSVPVGRLVCSRFACPMAPEVPGAWAEDLDQTGAPRRTQRRRVLNLAGTPPGDRPGAGRRGGHRGAARPRRSRRPG